MSDTGELLKGLSQMDNEQRHNSAGNIKFTLKEAQQTNSIFTWRRKLTSYSSVFPKKRVLYAE